MSGSAAEPAPGTEAPSATTGTPLLNPFAPEPASAPTRSERASFYRRSHATSRVITLLHPCPAVHAPSPLAAEPTSPRMQ